MTGKRASTRTRRSKARNDNSTDSHVNDNKNTSPAMEEGATIQEDKDNKNTATNAKIVASQEDEDVESNYEVESNSEVESNNEVESNDDANSNDDDKSNDDAKSNDTIDTKEVINKCADNVKESTSTNNNKSTNNVEQEKITPPRSVTNDDDPKIANELTEKTKIDQAEKYQDNQVDDTIGKDGDSIVEDISESVEKTINFENEALKKDNNNTDNNIISSQDNNGVIDDETQECNTEEKEDISGNDNTGDDEANDDDGDDDDDEEEEEAWDLKHVHTIVEIKSEQLKCMTKNCPLVACGTYVSSLDETNIWYSCMDCQDQDFGGWPTDLKEIPIKFMTEEHREAISELCTGRYSPQMPNLPTSDPSKVTSPEAKKTSAELINNQTTVNSSTVSTAVEVTPPPGINCRVINHTPTGGTSTKLAMDGNAKSKKVTPMPSKPSNQALAVHKKWQDAAKALGGERIVVSKPAAKKLICDILKDSFKPMNITDIFKVRRSNELIFD